MAQSTPEQIADLISVHEELLEKYRRGLLASEQKLGEALAEIGLTPDDTTLEALRRVAGVAHLPTAAEAKLDADAYLFAETRRPENHTCVDEQAIITHDATTANLANNLKARLNGYQRNIAAGAVNVPGLTGVNATGLIYAQSVEAEIEQGQAGYGEGDGHLLGNNNWLAQSFDLALTMAASHEADALALLPANSLALAIATVKNGEIVSVIPAANVYTRKDAQGSADGAAAVAMGGEYLGWGLPLKSKRAAGYNVNKAQPSSSSTWLFYRDTSDQFGEPHTILVTDNQYSDIALLQTKYRRHHTIDFAHFVSARWLSDNAQIDFSGRTAADVFADRLLLGTDSQPQSSYGVYSDLVFIVPERNGARTGTTESNIVYGPFNWQQAAKKNPDGSYHTPDLVTTTTYRKGEVVDIEGDGSGEIRRINSDGENNYNRAGVIANSDLLVREDIGAGTIAAIEAGAVWNEQLPRDMDLKNTSSLGDYHAYQLPILFDDGNKIKSVIVDGESYPSSGSTLPAYSWNIVDNTVGITEPNHDSVIEVAIEHKTTAFEPCAHPVIDGEIISRNRATSHATPRFGGRLINDLTGRIATGFDLRLRAESHNHTVIDGKFSTGVTRQPRNHAVELDANGQWGLDYLVVKDKAGNYYIYWWELKREGSDWGDDGSGKPWVEYVGTWGDDNANELKAGCSKVLGASLPSFRAMIEDF